MKHTKEIAVAVALALGVAGASQLYAKTHEEASAANAEVSEQVSGGPSAQQAAELSEHGLAAINDIHLARVAVNDGYVDNARDLLKQARDLLHQVKSDDTPITVQTDVKRDGKQVEHKRDEVRADMIPIMSEMQVVESYSLNDQARAADSASSESSKTADLAKTPAQPADAPSKADQGARAQAITKANEHLSNGDRTAAADALKLVDLTLVDQVVSMALGDTTSHVDQALKLIDADKLHEANLELKKVSDSLVLTTKVVVGPAESEGAANADSAQSSAAG